MQTSPTNGNLPTPRFLYFDLGNVLLLFDHEIGVRQMAAVAGLSADVVRQTVFGSGLQQRYEAGNLTCDEFYDEFCQSTGAQPDAAALYAAGGAIFEVNVSMKALLGQLASAGHRLGLLSNTCEMHWKYFSSGRYSPIPDVFEKVVLSHRERSVKPEPEIYRVAAERAGLPANEIFFVDDRADNVAGALAAGLDAVQYTTTSALVSDLRRRGVEFNW